MRLLHQRHDHDRDRIPRSEPHPTRAAIIAALDANLCRCGTHMRIVRAVERAAREHA